MPDCLIAPFVAPSGTTPLFQAIDPATGQPALVTDVVDNNAAVTLILSGNPTGGAFTTSFGGQTTAPYSPIPSPPAAYWRWNKTDLTPGTYDLAVNMFVGGTESPNCRYEVFDDLTLLGITDLNHTAESGFGGPTNPTPFLDSVLLNSASPPAAVKWYPLGRFTFATSNLHVRLSCPTNNPEGRNRFDADNLRIATTDGLTVVRVDSSDPPGDFAAYYGGWGRAVLPSQVAGQPPTADTFILDGLGAGVRYLVDPAVFGAAFTALSSVGAGNATVTGDGSSLNPLVVTDVNALGNAAQPLLTVSDPTNVHVTEKSVGGILPVLHVTRGSDGSTFDLPMRAEWRFWDRPGINVNRNNPPTMPTVRFLLPQYLPDNPFKYSVVARHDNGPVVPRNNPGLSDGWNTYQVGPPAGGVTGYTDQVRNAVGIGPWAKYRYWVTPPNQYRVAATWPANAGFSTDVIYTVRDVDGNVLGTYHVDQTLAPSGAVDQGVPWQVLGTFTLGRSTNGGHFNGLVVTQTNNTGLTMVADAVRFERLGADDSVRIHPADTLTYSAGPGWCTSVAGPAPAADHVAVDNRSGGTTYDQALLALPTTMKLGYNLPVMQSGGVPYWTNRARGSNTLDAYPTTLTVPSFNINLADSPVAVGGDNKSPNNLSAGDWDIRWKGMTNCTNPNNGIVNGFTEDPTRVIWPGVDANGYHRRTVTLRPGAFNYGSQITSLTINAASGPDGSGNYTYDFSDLQLVPKDTDIATAPYWNPLFSSNIHGVQVIRFLDILAAIDGNVADYADLTKPVANLSRNVSPKVIAIDLAGVTVRQYTGSEYPNFDTRFGIVLEFLFPAPHGIKLNQAFLPSTTAGGTVDLASTDPTNGANTPINLTFELNSHEWVCYPLADPNRLVTLAGPHIPHWDDSLGVRHYGNLFTMTNAINPGTMAGTLYMRAGSYVPLSELVAICNNANAAGADFYFNSHLATTDACLTSAFTYLAGNVVGKVYLECSNEVWNTGVQPYATASTNNAVFYGGSGDDWLPYYCEIAHHHHTVAKAAWVAAGRDPADLVTILGSQLFNSGYSQRFAEYYHAKSPPWAPPDVVVVANYLENAPSQATEYYTQYPFQNVLDGASVGQQLDLLEDYTVNGRYELELPGHHDALTGKSVDSGGHVTYLRPEWLPAKLALYEGGPDILCVLCHPDDHPGAYYTPQYFFKQHAIDRHPRMYGIVQLRYKAAQDSGAMFACRFMYSGSDFGGAGDAAWPTYRTDTMAPYVPGNPTQDAIQIDQVDNLPLQQSVTGGAIKAFTSRYGATGPSLPTTATLFGPTAGTAGVASAAFTVTLDAPAPSGGQAITLADSSGGNAFAGAGVSGTTLTIPSGTSVGTFTYLRAAAGTSDISIASTGLTIVGSPVGYVASAGSSPPPTGPGISVMGRVRGLRRLRKFA